MIGEVDMPTRISRRHMLELAAGAAVLGARSSFAAQAAQKIEQFDPAFAGIVDAAQPIRTLSEGYGGPNGQAEGPVWWAEDGGYLLFSDIDKARRIKYTPGREGVTVAAENTNRGNGLTRDLQGRLVVCEADARRVTRIEKDGSTTVIANEYLGKRFGRPNDVVVKTDGSVYFTDPQGGASGEPWAVSSPGVYRVSADRGTIHLLTDELFAPNGLAFSPGEGVLYIADSQARNIRAFDVGPNGLLVKRSDRVFVDLNGAEGGVPDGIKVDTQGNVYSGGPGGLYVIDKTGKKLGRIVHGGANTTNMAFGGADWKTLYFTSRNFLGAVNLKVAGLPVPAKMG
jgi:gluconolactonase